MIGSRAANFLHLIIELTNVSRVHADRTTTGLDRRKNILRIEVDVSDHGNTGLLNDNRKRLSILIGRAGNADNIAARCGQLCNLLQCRTDIVCFRCRHRLNRNGSPTTDGHIPHHDSTSLSTRKRAFVDARHP